MNDLELLLTVDTPENIDFNYQIAGLGSRFLAGAIDAIIMGVVQVMLVLILLAIVGFDLSESAVGLILAGFSLIIFGIMWGYYILFEVIWRGQSPGKRILKIRVLRTDGSAITLSETIIRNLVRIVDFLPAFYGVGVVAMFVNEDARRLGDLAARTLVVYEHEQVGLDSLAWESQRRKTSEMVIVEALEDPAIAGLPLDRLSDADLQVIEDFVRRHHDLRISIPLAKRIINMIEKRIETPVTARDFNYDQQIRWLNRIVVAARNRQ